MTSPTDIPGIPEPGSIAGGVRACIMLADFANTDAGNKINVVGGAWQVTQRVPAGSGLGLPRQSVVVVLEVPPEHANEPFPVSLALYNSRGAIVTVPGPAGPQPLRIGQNVTAASNFPGVPAGRLPARAQVILDLDGGMPLEPGDLYTWKLEIAGYANPQWQASFFVMQEVAPPVIG